jgi:hypothetical protein
MLCDAVHVIARSAKIDEVCANEHIDVAAVEFVKPAVTYTILTPFLE